MEVWNMEQVNIQAAKTHLSEILEKVAKGDSFIIAKAGKPVAKLVACDQPETLPRLGFMKGQFTVPDDFDSLYQNEIIKMFEGDPDEIFT